MRTEIAKVKGLGSAKEGTKHFWHQRLTAIALVFLGVWFIFSVLRLVGETRAEIIDWLTSPFNAFTMILFSFTLFFHGYLGIKVVIEDYVHTKWMKVLQIILWQFACILGAAISIFSVLSVYFEGYAL